MNFAIDLDGVVVDWDGGFRQVWNATHPDHQIPAQSRTWESPFEDTGLSHVAFWKWIDDCEVYANLPSCILSLTALRMLEREGHEITFVTNRHERAERLTEKWLKDRNLLHPVVHTSDKTVHEANIYVDDNNENLAAYVKARPTKTIVRVIRPWNEHVPGTIAVKKLFDLTRWPLKTVEF
jgi:uncharacterized HAD superfamily protein